MGFVAFLAADMPADASNAEHAAWWAWVLCGAVAITCMVAGWFVFTRGRATADQSTRWFRLLCVHDKLWGEPSPRRIAGDQLAGGMGLSLVDAHISTAVIHTQPFGRSWLGDSHATLVGVPESAAARMPFAASGCGVWALPVETPPVGAQVTRLPEQLTVPAVPGWFVGLSDAGEPMLIHPIPGATFALFGTPAQLRALEGSMNWPEEIFDLQRFGSAGSVDDSADATRAAGVKTHVVLVEISPAVAGNTGKHRMVDAQKTAHQGAHTGVHAGIGFDSAEDILNQGRARLQAVGAAAVDVCIAVPAVGTGAILAHGDHREYFNFFAVTAPARTPAPVAQPAQPATSAAHSPARSARASALPPTARSPKPRLYHGSAGDSLPMPTGERLARVVSARSARSSSAG